MGFWYAGQGLARLIWQDSSAAQQHHGITIAVVLFLAITVLGVRGYKQAFPPRGDTPARRWADHADEVIGDTVNHILRRAAGWNDTDE